jgi:ANTAR domain/GAF domain
VPPILTGGPLPDRDRGDPSSRPSRDRGVTWRPAGRRTAAGMVPTMSNLSPAVLAQLLEIRLHEGTMEELLTQYVQIAKTAMPGVDEVSITLVRGERPFTAAYTGELALVADELQYERGYGPCVDAGLSGTELSIPDMREETRWPDYAAAVVPLGVLSSVSLPLPVQTEVVGALNCYSGSPGPLDDAVGPGREIASYIAVAVSNALAHRDSVAFAADMQAAMASRAVIEQAKGVIMAQNRCTADEAFEILRRASMGRNVKLRDLAGNIVDALKK